MKHQTLIRAFATTAVMLTITFTAQAQLGGMLKKAKEAVEKEVEKVVEDKTVDTKQQSAGVLPDNVKDVALPGKTQGATVVGIPRGTKDIYVSATGSNRNTGGKSDPYKDIQKAVDEAPEGAVIHVTEGNYLGKLNAGYIEIKKYLSLVGGYSSDFSRRDPSKFHTTIQPPADAGGTNANKGLLDIYVRGKRDGLILVDGFTLDKGMQNKYVSVDTKNPKFMAPEGCETGMLNPPGMQISQPSMRGVTTVGNQLIHGDVEGNVVIRDCVFLNGSHYAIQMGNLGGHFDIYNNIFLASRMAACEVRGMNKEVGESTISFHHNTVLFTWRRDWVPANKDMGYGFRFMTRMDAEVYNNIIGCSDFSGIDRTYIDSDLSKEKQRKTSAYNNLFFGNIEADLTLPSGGGKFMRIFSDMFEDVDQLVKAHGNREMNDAEIETFSMAVDAAYLKAFLNMEGSSVSTYNPNSSENIFRSALGMNTRGVESNYVSMYANAYPRAKAYDLFGAIPNYGAQVIK
ncbi:MAG: DUF1565 domain-containing protein [Fermentimonas sp.]|jgi:hypothetical protein